MQRDLLEQLHRTGVLPDVDQDGGLPGDRDRLRSRRVRLPRGGARLVEPAPGPVVVGSVEALRAGGVLGPALDRFVGEGIESRQAAAGALYLDETGDARPELVKAAGGRGFVELHQAKLDALEDLVDELQGQPLLVAYEYKHDLARLLARWPGTPYIGGGTSEKKAAFAVKAWNAGGLPLLFGHPAAMGHGLNLQGGCRVCWFSPTWNFELYDQMIRRVWRQGQTEKCRVYRIVAKDTVDEDVLAALGRKDRGQQAFFDALRARRGKEGR